ncbi:hypothetical protein FAVG1_04261 [Fusarium avenaceum]|nr:hypothetical protein FAVG1_04261 [Fusarium avenaceum]
MPKRSRSRNPKKPPLKERFLAPFILEYARRQVRRGERAGTRQRRPQALLSAPPATGSSITASVPPTQSFPSPYLLGDLIANTALEPGHAQLGTTLYNNQTTPPHTIPQSGLEYPDFSNASHRQSTAAKASFGSTSGSDSHGTFITSTTRSTGLGESSLDNKGLLSELSPLASWTKLGTPIAPSTQGDLNHGSYQDYWRWFKPLDMTPAELGQHIQDMNDYIQQSALPPAQNLAPENESFGVKVTYRNGHQSREALQFNDLLHLNFVPQAFLAKLREDSPSPIDILCTPPGYERWAFTPDGDMVPLKCYLWAYLEYESPLVHFTASWVCLWVYHGTGAADDTKITLGHPYFTMLEEQAPM